MRKIIAYAALAAPLAAMAQAQDATMDADGDGEVSFDEMLVVYPELTEEVFGVLDVDASGGISEEEMTAAVESGLILPPEQDS